MAAQAQVGGVAQSGTPMMGVDSAGKARFMLLGPDGSPVSGLPPGVTANHSNVVAAASVTLLMAANPNRKPGSTIVNDSTAILYIKLAADAALDSYWLPVAAKSSIAGAAFIPDGYLGPVSGIWSAANGAARVTEMV